MWNHEEGQMTCEQLWRLLPDYLDAEMRRETCLELEAHTRRCPYCRAHVNTMRGTVGLTGELSCGTVQQEWMAHLRDKIVGGRGPFAV
jgi:predicted anti-sigma-YlaC factor YlaD